jgi:hypothetical protein
MVVVGNVKQVAVLLIILWLEGEGQTSTIGWPQILGALITVFGGNMVRKQQELEEARFFEHTRCVWASAFIETTKCLTNPPLCNTLPNSSHDSWDR